MNIIEETPDHKVLSFLKQNKIDSHSKIIAAWSGGSDSTALLALLRHLQDDAGYSLAALYIDHGIRPPEEMEAEYQLVCKTAQVLEVPLYHEKIPQGLIMGECRSGKRSIEEYARYMRYQAYENILEKTGFTHIALGHTMDDIVETMIMRFFQGSGVSGLRGIPKIRGNYIRPLIEMKKQDLVYYLQEKKIPWYTDSTNREEIYLRNTVRITLLEHIKRVFPGYERALLQLGEKMSHAHDALTTAYKPIEWKSLEKDFEKGILIQADAEEFFRADAYRRIETIFSGWNKITGKEGIRIPYRSIRHLAEMEKPTGKKLLVQGRGKDLWYQGGTIFWKTAVVLNRKKRYLKQIVENTELTFPDEKKFRFISGSPAAVMNRSRVSVYISYPAVVRSRREGDRISLSFGRQTLKQLFVEWGVSGEERWKIPVIEDRNGIAAVIGVPYGFKNCIAVRNDCTGKKVSVIWR